MAVDYTTGRRVAFGRAGSPPAQLPDAIAASCAIPGFYRAVEIDGRAYVDGGVYSTSNLDVLRAEQIDIALALNPMSSLHVGAPRTVGERLAFRMRQAAGRRLGSEAKRLRAAGVEVVLIQPTVHELDVMGGNLMSSRRRHEVIKTAVRTVTEHLRESPVGARLAELPAGDPRLVRQPDSAVNVARLPLGRPRPLGGPSGRVATPGGAGRPRAASRHDAIAQRFLRGAEARASADHELALGMDDRQLRPGARRRDARIATRCGSRR